MRTILCMLLAVAPAMAGQVETSPVTPADSKTESKDVQLRTFKDIVIDARHRTLLVFALPAKHRKVMAFLQRIALDVVQAPSPTAVPSLAPPKIPPKPVGPMATYKYKSEKVMTVLRDLAAEAGVNLIIRG